MNEKLDSRFNARKNEDGTDYWTVYDVSTGLPAVVNGTTLDALGMEEADDLVDLLNAQYTRRGGTTH
ncbi:hypothetical protein NFO65_26265 [Neorhizobium galegae]|uniref:hypothetical protein n=1 Tax=Neorhizobium galegae TaxID=399 RepID=UPI0006228151|nr:hypothetical protein [Neorhizobium galegae]MCQ1574235.1 hypothetical protein [Neorhizobium galegae]MCQ1837615.1 hypothetical protein [Neorhizobium galegae]UIY31686.1 hypothetical protein LZK73_32550 [Neorhizobium galegae]CDZ67966.1 Hypothetical protein NGAL_HAMBI2605_62490 [Neorhizobium galegae bv. orientalis]